MQNTQTRMRKQNKQLDVRANKAIIKMADTLEDINQKLDHIIKKQTNGFWLNDSRYAQ